MLLVDEPQPSNWWWAKASPGKRMAFALVMLPVAMWLLYSLVTDPHGSLHSGFAIGVVAHLASPLLLAFLLYQIRRAWRDLRGKSEHASSDVIT